jgi:hypothetical protein
LVILFISLVICHCLNPVCAEGILFNNIQDFNFIIGSFNVMNSTLLNFECNIIIVLCVARKPYGREMTPS